MSSAQIRFDWLSLSPLSLSLCLSAFIIDTPAEKNKKTLHFAFYKSLCFPCDELTSRVCPIAHVMHTPRISMIT